ncbi:MAG: hypothetical protein ACFFDN_08030 [Candidatus Hodarchaeota archaeon]
MGGNDKVSSILSVLIACLIIVPIIYVSILFNKVAAIGYAIIVTAISLGLYFPTLILYLLGSFTNSAKKIKIGFFLGVPAWILNLLIIIATIGGIILSSGQIAIFIAMASGLGDTPSDSLPALVVYLWQSLGSIAHTISTLGVLNIISMSLCLVFGSIVFERRANL